MNWEIITGLIALRYKLIWAKTRMRNGRIALFLSGYLLLAAVFIIVISGGFGAGMAAVRIGKGEMVARIVLSGVFFQALIAALALGFGVNNLLTDVELRRYPTTRMERLTVRHVIGIVDPFWAIFLMLELGLVVGLYVIGGYGFWKGLAAVLLLFVGNYLLARLLVEGVNRLMRRKSGGVLLMVFFVSIAILPSVLGESLKTRPSLETSIVNTLSYTPPFGAAAAMTRQGAPAAAGLGLLGAWLIGALALLAILENRPQVIRREEKTTLSWSTPYERAAALFTPSDAPFVAFWLRFYMRNVRFRTMYLLTLPLLAVLVFNFSRVGARNAPVSVNGLFLAGLGALPISGFLSTSRFAVNQFGYLGGGLRRFFLLPTDPAASLRAGSYASMLLGAWMIPAAIIAWSLVAPPPFDARRLIMLLDSGVAGLFLFHALGLWVTLLNPRKGDYNNNFGNDLSLAGNIVLIGGMFTSLGLPQLIGRVAPALTSPANWWISLAGPLVMAAFFSFSLRAAGPMFLARRERLLSMAEGRD